MIVLASSVGVGATRAYFTSDVKVNKDAISTGTVILTDTRAEWMLPFSISDIKPGQSVRKWVYLRNDGTLDIGSLTVNKSKVVDESNLLGQITISAMGRVDPADPAYFTDDWGTKPTVSSWFNFSDMLNHSFYRTPAGVLHHGDVYIMAFDFTMPATVDNGFQGKSASFDLTFTGEQVH